MVYFAFFAPSRYKAFPLFIYFLFLIYFPMAWKTSSTVMASMGSCLEQQPLWQSAHSNPSGRRTVEGLPQGPHRVGVVSGMGQKRETVGVPMAAARCMVPV